MPELFSPFDPNDQEAVVDKPKPEPLVQGREELPLQRDAPAHSPNMRWSQVTRRYLLISIGASIVTGLIAYYAARSSFEQEFTARLASDASAQNKAEPATNDAARTAEQITALQKQVDVMRREQLLLQQNTRESLEGISTALNNPKLASSQAPVAASTTKPGEARIADVEPQISPTQQEFIQLKERNRIAQYADEAIATGLRKPLEIIVEYMRDSDAKHLHEAATAEYLRAVRSIQFIQREDPGYRLPVAELFKDQNIRDEADVKPEALLKLLADHQQPWEVRVRVCFLLLGSEAPETNAKLIQAIKDDPSLDVAKHAQFALEQRIKRRFRIFDIPAIDAWAEAQKK